MYGHRRRSLSPSANPRGGEQPYISLEGHNIIDVRFGKSDWERRRLHESEFHCISFMLRHCTARQRL